MRDQDYFDGVNQPFPQNPQHPWQQGPWPQQPQAGPQAGGFPQPGPAHQPLAYPHPGQAGGHQTPTQASAPSAILIIAAITTCGISLGGGLIQTAMSMKSGFGDGNALFGSLVLTAAVLTLLFGIGGSILAMIRGSRTGRALVTVCCLFYLVNGTVTLVNGNTGSIVQLLIAIPLATLWWLPATSQSMRAKSSGARS